MLTMTGEATVTNRYTIAEVARRLGWSESTVHRHSVPLSEWKRDRGQVPLVRLGGHDYVPAWWLDETIRALTVAPE